MIKTLRTLFKQDKEKFVVPKSVQNVIPIYTIWEDGILKSFFSYAAAAIGIAAFALAEYKGTRTAE